MTGEFFNNQTGIRNLMIQHVMLEIFVTKLLLLEQYILIGSNCNIWKKAKPQCFQCFPLFFIF